MERLPKAPGDASVPQNHVETFIMKTMIRCLFLVLFGVFMAGCVRQEYLTTVLSETQPEYGTPQSLVYSVEPVEEREERNPRFHNLRARIERALQQRGIRTTRNLALVTGIIFVDVSQKTIKETHTYEEPIYKYGSEVTGAHGTYDKKTGKYSVSYDRTPTYEKKGYRKKKWTSYEYKTTLKLQGWDVKTRKRLWVTSLWCTTPSDDVEKATEAMLEGGKDYIAIDTYPVIHLNIEEDYDGVYTATVDD